MTQTYKATLLILNELGRVAVRKSSLAGRYLKSMYRPVELALCCRELCANNYTSISSLSCCQAILRHGITSCVYTGQRMVFPPVSTGAMPEKWRQKASQPLCRPSTRTIQSLEGTLGTPRRLNGSKKPCERWASLFAGSNSGMAGSEASCCRYTQTVHPSGSKQCPISTLVNSQSHDYSQTAILNTSPRVVASEARWNAFLLQHIDGIELHAIPDLDTWKKVARSLAGNSPGLDG